MLEKISETQVKITTIIPAKVIPEQIIPEERVEEVITLKDLKKREERLVYWVGQQTAKVAEFQATLDQTTSDLEEARKQIKDAEDAGVKEVVKEEPIVIKPIASIIK